MTANTLQGPLGLIVPPASGEVPYDGAILYPNAKFIARGLALPSVSPEGYDQVIDRVADLACELALDGAIAISLMGTSLSFYRGADFNRQLMRVMHKASNRPCTTMSQAVLNALEAVGAKKVAIATAYIDTVNQSLVRFLEENDYTVNGILGMAMTDVAAIQAVDTDALVQLCHQAWQKHGPADALILSCGGLKTLDVIKQMEAALGVPVISSSPTGFWDVMRTAGLDSRSPGHGAIFELPPPAAPRRNY